MSVNLGSAKAYLELDIKNFKSAWVQAEATSKSYSNSLTSKVTGAMSKVGAGLTSAGTKLTKTVTVPVVAAGAAIIKTSADFESGMSKVSAISGATGKDLESLRQKAIEMGAKTKFSASESADAFTYMAMAGWKTEEMLEGIDGIMALSAADGLDLATTSDIVTDGLTAFGLSAKDASHFADVLAQGSRNANLNVSMLGEAFKFVGPVAGSLGYSIEDVTKALGLMANVGIKSGQAGTSLRQALSSLINPTDDAAALMEKYGVSLFDGQGNAKDLMTVMKELRGTFGKVNVDIDKATEAAEAGDEAWAKYAKSLPMSEQEKLSSLTEMFGVRSMPAMLAIINTAEKDFNDLSKAIDNSNGTAQEMSDTMLNNLSGQITIIKSALEGFAISIGDILLPYLKKFAERIQGIIDWLNGLDESQKKTLVRIAGIVAAIGPALIIVGKVLTVGAKLINGFRMFQTILPVIKAGMIALKGSFVSVGAPVLAIVAVIAILIAAFKHLWDTNEGFRKRMTAIWNQIKDTVQKFVSAVKERIEEIRPTFEKVVAVIKKIWDGFCQIMAPIFEGAFAQIKNIIETVTNIVIGILDVFIGLFTGDWDRLKQGVEEIFGALWNYVCETFTNTKETLLGIAETILSWFGTSWNQMWTNVGNFFKNIWNNIKTFFNNFKTNLVNGFKNFITNIITFFKNLPYNIGYLLGQVIGHTVKFVVNFVQKAKEAGKKFVENIITFFKEIPGKVHNWFIKTKDKAIKFATEFPGKAKDAATRFINNIITFFTQLPGKVQQWFTNTINKAKSFATNMANKGKESATKFKNNIINGIKSIPSKVVSIGKNIVEGLWNGIKNAGTWIKNKVGEFAKGILDGMKSALGIHSPSREFEKQVGVNIPKGIAKGIAKEEKSTIKQLKGLAKSMLTTASKSLSSGNFEAAAVNATKSVKTSIDKLTKNSIIAVKNTVEKQVKAASKNLKKSGKDNMRKAGTATIKAYTDAINTAATKAESLVSKKLDKIAKKYQEKYNAIVAKQNDLKSKLNEYGDLYTIDDDGKMHLNNLKEQTKVIKDYGENLTKIKGKVSTDLFNEISQMSVEDGSEYVKQLLALSSKDLKEYNKAYTAKIKAAKTVSNKVYAEDVEEVKSQYNKAVDKALKDVNKKLNKIGSDAMKGFIKGMKSQTKGMNSTIKSLANDIVKQFKKSLKIKSPSKVMANEVGIFIPQGIGQGFEKSMPDATKKMNKSLTRGLLKLRDNEIEIPIDTEFDTGKIIKFEAAYEKMRNNINSSKLVVNFDDNIISSFDTISDKVRYLKQNALVLHTNESATGYVGYTGFSQAPQSKTDNQVQPQGPTNNTFNFYSPKAIDPIEASRQMKKVERELTEGF